MHFTDGHQANDYMKRSLGNLAVNACYLALDYLTERKSAAGKQLNQMLRAVIAAHKREIKHKHHETTKPTSPKTHPRRRAAGGKNNGTNKGAHVGASAQGGAGTVGKN